MLATEKYKIQEIVEKYIADVKAVLGKDFEHAVIYGSFVRDDFSEESDIDIAIFTNRPAEEFYLLVDKIAELTFEYSVKYDLLLSPTFQNVDNYSRWIKVLPYYQNIQKEGIAIGQGNGRTFEIQICEGCGNIGSSTVTF